MRVLERSIELTHATSIHNPLITIGVVDRGKQVTIGSHSNRKWHDSDMKAIS